MYQAAQNLEYQPRRPAEGILHRVVRDHLEEFLLEAASKFEGRDSVSFES